MKWIYRLLIIAILGAAMAFPFFMNNHDNKPMFSLPNIENILPNIENILPSFFTSVDTDVSDFRTFYKWKDKEGVWHYSDEPPTNGAAFSAIQVNNNANVIPSIPVKTKEETVANIREPSAQPAPPAPPSGDVLSLERAMNVLGDAKNVQNLMNERNSQLDALVGNPKKQ